MAQLITAVAAKSPAARAGLRAGDVLERIGGEVVYDLIDYQALTACGDVEIVFRRGGAEKTARLRKGEYDDPGLEFERPLMSAMRMCCNRCLFCFVDQLPENVRPTMRVKDDDWRMSLMTGSYVTLTNVSDREIERIIRRRVSPLYISVHAAEPALRSRILGTPRAARLADQLRKLSDGGIEFHTQAVLCPGLNDGAALDETIERLLPLKGARSLALVPVGLTAHREGLCPLRGYTREEAAAVIRQAEAWQEKLLKIRGTRFVFPADEFYLKAGVAPPPDEAYEGYEQIDDGVGLLRLLETEFAEAWAEREPYAGEKRVRLTVACGTSAAPFLEDMLKRYPVEGVDITVVPVVNRFFGESVTVSGLVTGGDLTGALKDTNADAVLITCCMLRSEGDRFLDDMTLEEAEAKLGRPVIPVGRSGEDLLGTLTGLRK